MRAWLIISWAAYSIWNVWIVSVETQHGLPIRGLTTSNVVTQFTNMFAVPEHLCQIWKHEGHRRVPVTTITSGRHSIGARPISGDHIHMAISIWIGDKPRPPEHDRPYHENIEYEDKPQVCQQKGPVAYTKLWPHAGVHTHCDGLIHVHPWSAPRSIRKEGVDVTLGLWFDQVGIQYRRDGLQFKDTLPINNNATHMWRLAEYKCVHDRTFETYVTQLDRVWLGHAYSAYTLWYGTSSTPPPMIREHVDTLSHWGATGYDGHAYPQNCI